jgi:energy-coupling factor transport system substrate-specific component
MTRGILNQGQRTFDIYQFTKRSSVALLLTSLASGAGFLWPFFVSSQESARQSQVFFWIAAPLIVLLLLSELSNQRLDAKSVALLGVLAATLAALRPLGAGAVGIEPMWFLLILSARVFGRAFGFLLGVIGMLASAMLTGGFGPWLSYQLFAAGWIGLLAGSLPSKIRGRTEIFTLVLFAIFASLAFGLLMDLQFWPWALGSQTQLSFVPGEAITENLRKFVIFHFASSMAWDIPRAILTSTLIIVTGPSVLNALRRTHHKASFLAPVDFVKKS